MCGIVGIVATHRIEDRSWLVKGRDAMTHRGPDGSGEWWSSDGNVGLGHRRLAIVELSSLGHQPMCDEANGLTIVFNGEIYNHGSLRKELSGQGYEFRSHSDTEVILAAYTVWGENCLSRLNGMFAIAIYDTKRQRLFLARDRAGEKPLFYHLADGKLQFASELKGLLANPKNPRRINRTALDCLLTMGFVPGNHCILQGYNKLPPAHALSFDLLNGTARQWQYWSLPELCSQAGWDQFDETKILDELESLFEDAVGSQLSADVPTGILLSGGLDSSLVTAMAVRRSSRVRTFSIGFPGHGKFDETAHARLVAQHFGTEHNELMLGDLTADLLPRLAIQFDEPLVDSSMIPTFLVSELVRRECSVVLGGDGGDELFGGYSEYSRLLWLQQYLKWIPNSLCRAVALSSKHFLSPGFANRNIKAWLLAIGQNLNKDLPLLASYFDPIARKKLMKAYEEYPFEAESIRSTRIPVETDLLQRMTRMDFQNYLSEDILVKVDRASMLNSLEVRSPFLDYRMIEFAYGRVPSHLKATAADKKILLKRLAGRVLPKEFDKQRKQGFSLPLNDLLKSGPIHDLFWDTLSDPDCLFDRGYIKTLLEEQKRGLNNGERLFALVEIELWRKYYGVTF